MKYFRDLYEYYQNLIFNVKRPYKTRKILEYLILSSYIEFLEIF